MSPEFLSRAERFQASTDPDQATAETVRLMAGQIHRSAADSLVIANAVDAVRRYRGGPVYAGLGGDPFQDAGAIAESAWWFAKEQLRFRHHGELLAEWLRERDQLQLLIEPSVLLRMRDMVGDCAIYSMLICAFLEALGVRWELVTLACNPSQPAIWSHVFARAVLADGRRLALDASHGKYAGWQVPREHQFRRQVWDVAGAAIADQDPGTFSGLHNFVRPHRSNWPAGLGQDDSLGVDLGSTVDVVGSAAGNYALPVDSIVQGDTALATGSALGLPALGSDLSLPAGSVIVPSQSAANWPAVVAQLAKTGMTLAEIQAIQPGTVVGANGQILRQATGYPVTTTGISTTGASSYLMIGGLALLAVLLLQSMRGR